MIKGKCILHIEAGFNFFEKNPDLNKKNFKNVLSMQNLAKMASVSYCHTPYSDPRTQKRPINLQNTALPRDGSQIKHGNLTFITSIIVYFVSNYRRIGNFRTNFTSIGSILLFLSFPMSYFLGRIS